MSFSYGTNPPPPKHSLYFKAPLRHCFLNLIQQKKQHSSSSKQQQHTATAYSIQQQQYAPVGRRICLTKLFVACTPKTEHVRDESTTVCLPGRNIGTSPTVVVVDSCPSARSQQHVIAACKNHRAGPMLPPVSLYTLGLALGMAHTTRLRSWIFQLH